jgi:carboxyl-terminal processing protease
VVVGSQTYGKGSVQTVVELEDGSALKLTVARYFTPKHRSIQDRGVTPDVPVAASEQPPAAPEEPRSGGEAGAPRPDPQLGRAVDLLRAARVFLGPGVPTP